jgi:DNA polymerase-1
VCRPSPPSPTTEAMLRCVAAIDHQGLRARLVCQLHDEVLFEVREEHVHACVAIVRQQLEHIGQVDGQALPRLPVSIHVGPSWGSMHAVEA